MIWRQKLTRYRVSKGDVCITIVGANVGEMGVVPPELDGANLTENAVRITSNGKIVQGFLKYTLLAQDALAQMKVLAGGAAQPKLGIYKIETIEIPLPPLPTQRKIAAILSAYDDLIENNLRRIKILEEMAQNLYREWFVKFRFPGHQHVRFTDSPLGQIPESWEVVRLNDVCHLTMGQSPKSEFYNTNGMGLPFHQGVTDFGDRFPTERLYCTIEGRIAEEGDILFSVRAPVGRINIANTRMVIGRGLSAIRHKAGCQWFAFHLLTENFKEEDTMGGGTIFKSVTKNDMENIAFIVPAEALTQRFEQLVEASERQIENLTKRNTALRRTRDLLVPKLISGEVDVSELDIAVPEEAGA